MRQRTRRPVSAACPGGQATPEYSARAVRTKERPVGGPSRARRGRPRSRSQNITNEPCLPRVLPGATRRSSRRRRYISQNPLTQSSSTTSALSVAWRTRNVRVFSRVSRTLARCSRSNLDVDARTSTLTRRRTVVRPLKRDVGACVRGSRDFGISGGRGASPDVIRSTKDDF